MKFRFNAKGLKPWLDSWLPTLKGLTEGYVKVADGVEADISSDLTIDVSYDQSRDQVLVSLPNGISLRVDKTILHFVPVHATEQLVGAAIDGAGVDLSLAGMPMIRLEAQP